jgi:ferritin
MLKKSVEEALNGQIKVEAESSHFYLAMASWAEVKGFNGTATFMYTHADEERMHMLKLIRFVNERGGYARIPSLPQHKEEFDDLSQIFSLLLEHETKVTDEINHLVGLCLEEKDYTTHNFLQWYVAEQMEEEALARTIIDNLNLLKGDKSGLYLFDRDLAGLRAKVEATKGKEPA